MPNTPRLNLLTVGLKSNHENEQISKDGKDGILRANAARFYRLDTAST